MLPAEGMRAPVACLGFTATDVATRRTEPQVEGGSALLATVAARCGDVYGDVRAAADGTHHPINCSR
jgi:hypothetical protein